MNFIKKKLKSHKKDDEEEEYEKAVYEQSLHSGDQKMKNTEEWQFFQQLSMKVQDTVQKTQTTLNKLKDIRQDSVTGKEEADFYGISSGSTSQDFITDSNMSYGASKVASAPPRPPPPTADKSVFPGDSPLDSEIAQGLPLKAPPRPPPPPGADIHLFSDSALHGISAKSSPARPPPPAPTKYSPIVPQNEPPTGQSFLPLYELGSQPVADPGFSLLDEFGFQKDETVTVSAKSNFQDLLFLDVKEESDPFDTSFVDVTSIGAHNPSLSKEANASEGALNPFAFDSGMAEQKSDSDGLTNSLKNVTNPFFSATDENNFSDDGQKISDTMWSMHNPFSAKKEVSSSHNADQLVPNLLSDDANIMSTDPYNTNDIPLMLPVEREIENVITPAIKSNGLQLDDILSMDDPFSAPPSNQADEDLSGRKQSQEWSRKESIGNGTNLLEIVSEPIKPDEKSDDTTLWASETVPSNHQNSGLLDCSSAIPDTTPVSNIEVIDNSINVIDFFDNEPITNADVTEPITPYNSKLNGNGEVPNVTDQAIDFPSFTENAKSEQDSIPFEVLENKDISVMSLKETESEIASEEKATLSEASADPISSDSRSLVTDKPGLLPFDEGTQSFSFSFKASEERDQEFDEFSAKFESAKGNTSSEFYDPFSSGKAPSVKKIKEDNLGFGSMDEFDPFKVTKVEEKAQGTLKKEASRDSFEEYDNEADFSVVIKPKVKDSSSTDLLSTEPPKLLPPPPKTPTKAFDSNALRFNPFDKDSVITTGQTAQVFEKVIETEGDEEPIPALGEAGIRKADSVDTPLSPLFDEDTSLPLEVFPQPFPNEGWEMVLRQPNKKKLTGNRFWKKIFVKLSENSVLQLFNKKDDKLPFQELPLQACYSLSEVGAQQYDQYGKIFTVKLQYKFYRERVGVRPGQISKVAQGHITSMSDVAKLGLPLQHAPQTSQLLKLGTQSYIDIKFFIQEIEDALFRMVVHRDRVLTYKTEEIQVIAQDEFYVEQTKTGRVDKQLARVRIFFLAFITGMPSVEVGLNDINRQGKEVVGRYDIIPVVTEEWIRLEDCEFHSCVIQDEFKKTRIIKFHPPDACLFELLRFRIRPPKNRELPLQVRVFMSVSSSRVEIRSDILVPGYSSRKQGQIPCENIQIRFPIPECWIYLFRTEKHFRYGSKKSAARRPGKIKGLERIIGAAQNLDPSLIEVSAGQAKYEHVFHAVVWRIPRLPKEGQGAYTQQLFLLRTELTAFDQIPETFEPYVDVEFTMPATYVSHTTVRSVSVSNPSPPEKYVRYVSKHEYKVEIEFKSPDDIDGLVSSPSINVPVTSAAVQESTEDEKEEEEDSD